MLHGVCLLVTIFKVMCLKASAAVVMLYKVFLGFYPASFFGKELTFLSHLQGLEVSSFTSRL
jgi:hypothetical protein